MFVDEMNAHARTETGDEAVDVRIAGTDVRVSIRPARGDTRTLDRPLALEAALDGIERTCRAVLQKLVRAVPADAGIAFTIGSAAKTGSLLATVTVAVLFEVLEQAGLRIDEADRAAMIRAAADDLVHARARQAIAIPHDVAPPFHFSPLVPGIPIARRRALFRSSAAPAVTRPAALEDLAFWPVRDLAALVQSRQVTSMALTEMYLARLRRFDATLHHVVTFLDDLAIDQAARADAEMAEGRSRGPLHGIPWGVKDTIAVRGYPTTWGVAACRDRVFDHDASVVRMLRDAGAVLIAKLATGALAAGDHWFGGRTNNPWDPQRGAAGSSSGSAAATAAGCVGFAVGTDTDGSILGPAATCGVVGLKPTFGRVSRDGVMIVSWTLDRVGPICRAVEDCALVMRAIAKPDGRDMSVSDVPFTWNAARSVATVRVGYLPESFDDLDDPVVRANARHVLDTVQTLGVSPLIPITPPALDPSLGDAFVESAAFLDDMVRRGAIVDSPYSSRHVARLMPAVEYLQSQRVRTMLMIDLAAATADVDVYLVASNAPGPDRRLAQRLATMASVAGYPAIAVPNGFTAAGLPTHVTLFARPFGEAALLCLAKACHDASMGVDARRPAEPRASA